MNKKIAIAKITMLILCVLYILVTVFAMTSLYTINTNIKINTINVWKLIWSPLLLIFLFLASYILYIKKPVLGATIEMIIALIVAFNILRNTVIYGANGLVLIFSFILILSIFMQGLVISLNSRKKELTKTKIKK